MILFCNEASLTRRCQISVCFSPQSSGTVGISPQQQQWDADWPDTDSWSILIVFRLWKAFYIPDTQILIFLYLNTKYKIRVAYFKIVFQILHSTEIQRGQNPFIPTLPSKNTTLQQSLCLFCSFFVSVSLCSKCQYMVTFKRNWLQLN